MERQILVCKAHIPHSPAIERQRTGAHTVRAGKLRPLGVLLPCGRKSPELAHSQHRPSEKSASRFLTISPLARTSDFCAGRRISFAEASAALPQIAPCSFAFLRLTYMRRTDAMDAQIFAIILWTVAIILWTVTLSNKNRCDIVTLYVLYGLLRSILQNEPDLKSGWLRETRD